MMARAERFRRPRVTTQAERNYPEDVAADRTCFHSCCQRCRRNFVGHKRRRVCRACAAPTTPAIGGLIAGALAALTGKRHGHTD